ncbi:MAG: hypothetical protein HY064_14515 [Bacteroidetes bacterium]|nr:hypothetical protein [Bacteroidota bacterium]
MRTFFFFLLLPSIIPSQNLVVNPGFEDWNTPDLYYATMQNDAVKGWYDPGMNSSDFYKASPQGNENNMSVSIGGLMTAHSGSSFAGFLGKYGEDYREYMAGSLVSPLEKGTTYSVKFFLALGPGCYQGVKELGIFFGDSATINKNIHGEFTPQDFKLIPQVKIQDLDYDNYSGQWKEFDLEFTANGGEKNFVIGNFLNDAQSVIENPKTKTAGTLNWTYYYIDDFDVEPKNKKPIDLVLSPVFSTADIQPGKIYTSSVFSFVDGKSEWNESSSAPLLFIAHAMKTNPSLKLEIDWYTDGHDALADTRVHAISDFIAAHGIPATRISTHTQSPGKNEQPGVRFIFSK